MKKYFILLISQGFSLIGSAVVEFALAWYITRETGSATILATAMMVAMVPPIVLGPFLGPFVDRWDRKKIMIYSDLAITLMTIGLVFLFLTNTIELWHIYLAMAGRAIGQTFQFPAMMATVAVIVPEKHLARANGLSQMLQGGISIASPPAGAFLMELLPMQGVLAVDIGTAAIAIFCLLPLAIPATVRTTLSEKANVIADMVQGLRYLWKRRGLSYLTGLMAAMGFFVIPVATMMPMLVNDYLAGDVIKLGWMNSSFGVGIIVGGLLLGIWGGFKKRMFTVLLGNAILSVFTIGLGFTSERLFYWILADCLLLGAGLSIFNAPFMAILNSVVAKDMQGRVITLVNSLSSVMGPLGLAVAGPVADAFGTNWIFIIGGAALLVMTPLAFFSRQMMNLESHPADEQPATAP